MLSLNNKTAANLTEYNWTYQGSKASKPLVLSFDDNQRLIKLVVIIKAGLGKLKVIPL
jgi:anti-sigma-K factor RskA